MSRGRRRYRRTRITAGSASSGVKADDSKRLRELEHENARLKRIVADQVLENQALKQIPEGNW